MKNAVLQFLASEIFTADEIIVHLLVAAGDPRHSVSDQGDHNLKQFGSSVDWENPTVIGKLFSLYQGTVATPGKRPSVRFMCKFLVTTMTFFMLLLSLCETGVPF